MDTRPGVSSFTDRHGRLRWRYRRKSKTVALPGQPGEPAFEAAYLAALAGQPRPAAVVRRHPSAALPKTLGAAWRLVQQSPEWKALGTATQYKNIRYTEEFLARRVAPEHHTKWQDIPVEDLKRRHLKGILSDFAATPHKAKHVLTAIRRMIAAAMDAEWIEADPSHGISWRPSYTGWKAWPAVYLRAYQDRWPVGTKQRLVYALAFWLGNRAGDIASLRWAQRSTRIVMVRGEAREVDGFNVAQGKGGKQIFVPISPALAEVLAATAQTGPNVLTTAYGHPHSKKSLTNDMATYTAAAGIPPGYTLHGLRKSLGKMLAEGGSTTRQIMEVLGHDNIEHAELYSREAEQALLATEGMDKVILLHQRVVG